MNISDIIILSTHWEGLPLIPLEAGAAKKPIIASGVSGVKETIVDGKTGFLVAPNSADALAKGILELYQKEQRRTEMGLSAYQFVARYFNKDRMVQEYQNLYQSIK